MTLPSLSQHSLPVAAVRHGPLFFGEQAKGLFFFHRRSVARQVMGAAGCRGGPCPAPLSPQPAIFRALKYRAQHAPSISPHIRQRCSGRSGGGGGSIYNWVGGAEKSHMPVCLAVEGLEWGGEDSGTSLVRGSGWKLLLSP